MLATPDKLDNPALAQLSFELFVAVVARPLPFQKLRAGQYWLRRRSSRQPAVAAAEGRREGGGTPH